MPGFLSPGKGVPLLIIPEYSGINKGQRVPDRSKTALRKPLVKRFLTSICIGRSPVRCPPKAWSPAARAVDDTTVFTTVLVYKLASRALNDSKCSYLVIWISSAK